MSATIIQKDMDFFPEPDQIETLTEAYSIWHEHQQALKQIEEDLAAQRDYGQRLSKTIQKFRDRLATIAGGSEKDDGPSLDGRKISNPERDLKISIVRIFEHAKRAGKDAKETRDRALSRAKTRAMSKYHMHELPETVVNYIDELYEKF